MMNYCRAGGWLLLSVGLALAASSCDGKDDVSQLTAFDRPSEPSAEAPPLDASRCVPGQTSTCVGVCQGFALGYQVCAADGRSYGSCICPAVAPIASIGGDVVVIPPRIDPGSQVPVDVPGALPRAASIGASCVRDADCGGDLNCFEADTDSLGLGGPAGGYCTTGCDTSADCTAIERASTCGTLGGRSLCVHTCRSQAPEAGVDKCLARPDLTCVSSAALGDEEPTDEPQFGVCLPRCQSDAGCAGQRCDLSTGLCTAEPRAGDPLGAACEEPESCAAGICLGATAGRTGFCSAFCTVGVDGCGFDGSEARIDAACILPQIPSEGLGDRGLCFELCDVAEDCTEPGFTCVAEPTRGRAGACVPAQGPADPGPPAEPEPGAENLGLPCESDGDCGGELSCLTSGGDPFGVGGGPAQGYCSTPCAFVEDCPGGSVCATTPGGGYCLRACDVGSDGDCGRDTALCTAIGGSGACLPDCTSSDECGARACDPGLGLCVDAVGPAPVDCATDDDCTQGVCDPLLRLCVLAPDPECTTDADCPEGPCDTELGVCVEEPECATDSDCEVGACDTELGLCVEEPEPVLECTTDVDCAGGVCDEEAGTCSEAPLACTSNADCDTLGVCDAIDLICIEAPPRAIGAACSEDVQCTGESPARDETRRCLELGGSNFCSAVCLWGTPLGCEAYGTDAFCVYPVDDTLGACLELCNVSEDCEQTGYVCLSIGTTINDRTGACLPPQPGGASFAPLSVQ
jgi:hypothetical protein